MRKLSITEFANEYKCSRINVFNRIKRSTLGFHAEKVGNTYIIFVPNKINLFEIQSVKRIIKNKLG